MAPSIRAVHAQQPSNRHATIAWLTSIGSHSTTVPACRSPLLLLADLRLWRQIGDHGISNNSSWKATRVVRWVSVRYCIGVTLNDETVDSLVLTGLAETPSGVRVR